MQFLVNLLVSALSVFLAAKVIPGVDIEGFGSAVIVAVLIGILNATLGLVLKVITFPINFITLGLIGFLINVFMIRLVDMLMGDFTLSGFWAAVLFAIVVALVNPLLRAVFGGRDKERD